MAAVGATDVTYTLQGGTDSYRPDGKYEGTFKMAFGTGLTYPAGGIPITKAKFGTSNAITDLQLSDPGSGSGYVFKYNYTSAKIQIYQSSTVDVGAHVHNILIIGGAGAATTNTLQQVVATASLAQQLAGNVTVAGAGSATLGGIVPATISVVSAAGLTELGTAATVGACTLYARVIGW